jgi:hypothetical protein
VDQRREPKFLQESLVAASARRLGATMSKSEMRTRWTELLELEELLSQLMVTALKLPPSLKRRNSLVSIGCFRDRIIAMKRAEVDRFSTMQKTG